MDIFTAQYRYDGPNRLDITVKGQDPVGKLFAPTWSMVMGLKNGSMTEEGYTQVYNRILDNVFAGASGYSLWQDFSRQERVTFVCFCPTGAFCHRVLLAVYLQKAGWGVYRGELKLS